MSTDSKTKICSVGGCDKFVRARSLCASHYSRLRRTGDPLGVGFIHKDDDPKCSIDECGRFAYSKGLCQRHYNRLVRHGDPLAQPERKKRQPIPVEQRIWKFVDNSDPHGCWPWTGSQKHGGYGEITVNGKSSYAHKVMYEMLRGKLPEGQIVRHTCDNPTCVRPDHLIPGTQADNMRDVSDRSRWGNKTRINGEETGYIPITGGECSESGCFEKVVAKGLCSKHYQRQWKKRS